METIDRLWQLLNNPVIRDKIVSGEIDINWSGITHTQDDRERVEGFIWYHKCGAAKLEEKLKEFKRRKENG